MQALVDVARPVAGVPERSLAQRLEALENANRVRSYRAQLKRDLKARRKNVALLLQDPPERIHSMPVQDLLLAVPGLGRVKVATVLRRLQISPSKTVGGLSPRQRHELIRALAGR